MDHQRFLPLLMLGLIAIAGCQSRNTPISQGTPAVKTSPSKAAPAGPVAPGFILTGYDGKTFDLSKQRGKGPVLVNFFATW